MPSIPSTLSGQASIERLLGQTATSACTCTDCVQGLASHETFLTDFPEDPETLMDDFHRMGLIRREAYPIAEKISQAELRELLFFRHASQGNPEKEQLLRALASEAGGLDQAFAAAFGPQAGHFFCRVSSNSPLGRRTFMKGLAAGAALVTLANCGVRDDRETEQALEVVLGQCNQIAVKHGRRGQ